jgi:hypothetical protein
VQRLEFVGPNERALRWIASRRGGLINYIEVATDNIFDTPDEREAAWEFFHRHLTRRYHRRTQGIQFHDNDTTHARYDALPNAPNLITVYRDEWSRIDGQLNVLHVEWRATGVDAVRALGIHHARDVLTRDHRKFWEERLRFYAIDAGRLGRLYRNRSDGTRSHRITAADRSYGNRILGRYQTIQEFIDDYRPGHIQHVLTPLSTQSFLPH